MAIFNSYVKLPEGIQYMNHIEGVHNMMKTTFEYIEDHSTI